MTKQEILEKFKDIDFVYNDSSKHDTLSRMLDELLKEQEETINDLTETIRQLNQHIKDLSEYMTPYGKVKDVKAYAELLKEQEEREQAICKEICDFIRSACCTDTDDDKDYVCYVIQNCFKHFCAYGERRTE